MQTPKNAVKATVKLYALTAVGMRGGVATIVLAMLAVVKPAGAFAMSAPARANGRCQVIAAEKLPADAGGAKAICDAIERAVAETSPNTRFSVDVKVVSRFMLATKIVVNGQALPEQKFAVSDKNLNSASIKRFANSIAAKISNAARP